MRLICIWGHDYRYMFLTRGQGQAILAYLIGTFGVDVGTAFEHLRRARPQVQNRVRVRNRVRRALVRRALQ